MRIKKGFVLRDVCGEKIVVAEGKENIDFTKIINMNESAAFLWEKVKTPVRDKIAISCMLIQIREFSSHAITHELYIKNRKRLFCL